MHFFFVSCIIFSVSYLISLWEICSKRETFYICSKFKEYIQRTFFYYLQEEFSFTHKLGINSTKDPIDTTINVISYVLFMIDFAQIISSLTQFTKCTACIPPVLTFSIICLKNVTLNLQCHINVRLYIYSHIYFFKTEQNKLISCTPSIAQQNLQINRRMIVELLFLLIFISIWFTFSNVLHRLTVVHVYKNLYPYGLCTCFYQ